MMIFFLILQFKIFIFQQNKTVLYIQKKSQKDIFLLYPPDDLYTAISPVLLGYKSTVSQGNENILDLWYSLSKRKIRMQRDDNC